MVCYVYACQRRQSVISFLFSPPSTAPFWGGGGISCVSHMYLTIVHLINKKKSFPVFCESDFLFFCVSQGPYNVRFLIQAHSVFFIKKAEARHFCLKEASQPARDESEKQSDNWLPVGSINTPAHPQGSEIKTRTGGVIRGFRLAPSCLLKGEGGAANGTTLGPPLKQSPHVRTLQPLGHLVTPLPRPFPPSPKRNQG